MAKHSISRPARYALGGLLVALLSLAACAPAATAPAASKPAAAQPQAQAPAQAPAQSQTQPQAKPELEPYKIGATFVMSGGQAEFSRRQLVAGMQMAIDELNDAGGVDGHKLTPIYEDSRGEPGAGVAAMRKLVEVDKVPVMQSIYTFIVFAQMPVAEETKTVIFAPSVEHPELTTRSQWTARAALNSVDNAMVMADFIGKTLGFKRMVIIYEDQEGVVSQLKPFTERYSQELGGQIVGQEGYKQGDTDFRNHIAKLRGLNAEFLWVIGANSVDKPRVIKQVREAGWNIPVGTQAPFEDPEVLAVGGSALEGVMFITSTFTPEFADRFEKKYGYPPDNIAAKHYDGMMITAEAIRRGGYSGEGIRRALNEITELDGGQGKLVNNGQREWKPSPVVKMVKDGKFVPYQP
jgi:branched-chain amino acid transport system substrate-binding protein